MFHIDKVGVKLALRTPGLQWGLAMCRIGACTYVGQPDGKIDVFQLF